MSSELIERMAKAMYVSWSTNHNPSKDWDELRQMPQHNLTINHYLRQAKAALKAIREPTDNIKRIVTGSIYYSAADIWQAMIDAELEE